MSEFLKNQSPEQHKIEVKVEGGEKRLERLRQKAEKAAEAAKGNLEQARAETEQALSKLEKKPHKNERGSEKSRRPIFVSIEEKRQNYKTTLKEIQNKLPPTERAFSKIIHNPIVERVSEVSGKTVARPSGVLGGSIAIILGLSVSYYSATNAGFELSGGEFIWFLISGFALGVTVEWIIKTLKTFNH